MTTGVARAAASAAAVVSKRASFSRFFCVAKTSLKRPFSAPARASAGETQTESTDSVPSCTARCASGAAARKNCVS